MSNFTPSTATVIPISTTPYTESINAVSDPDGTGYPNCSGAEHSERWWKISPPADNACTIQILNIVDGGGLNVFAVIRTGTPPTLPVLTYGGSNEFCQSATSWNTFPLNAGTDYYIQVVADSPGLISYDLVANFSPNSSIAAGDILICNDTDGVPAVIFDQTTGTIKKTLPFPAGEFADTLPTGEIATVNGTTDNQVIIYNGSTFATIATYNLPAGFITGIRADKNNSFYIAYSDSGTSKVVPLSKTGVAGTIRSLPHNLRAFAITRDGTIIYYLDSLTNSKIYAYNISTGTDLGLLVNTITGLQTVNDGFVDPTGNIWFGFNTTATQDHPVLKVYSNVGTLLHTYSIGSTTQFLNHFNINPDDLTLTAWLYTTSLSVNPSIFQKIKLSDGTNSGSPVSMVASGSGQGSGSNIWVVDNSCPILMMPVAIISSTSGIYQIVPNKRTDTLYSTGIVKIPDPFFKSPLLGG